MWNKPQTSDSMHWKKIKSLSEFQLIRKSAAKARMSKRWPSDWDWKQEPGMWQFEMRTDRRNTNKKKKKEEKEEVSFRCVFWMSWNGQFNVDASRKREMSSI